MAKQHVLDLERKREEQENDQILHTICFILFIYIYILYLNKEVEGQLLKRPHVRMEN